MVKVLQYLILRLPQLVEYYIGHVKQWEKNPIIFGKHLICTNTLPMRDFTPAMGKVHQWQPFFISKNLPKK